MKKIRTNKKKGFTLIELIVVIAILGILAAILIPSFSGIQASATKKAVYAEARTALTAMETYKADNGSYPATVDLLSTYGLGNNNTTCVSFSASSGTFTYTNKGYKVTVSTAGVMPDINSTVSVSSVAAPAGNG